jgi:hypothetical protein
MRLDIFPREIRSESFRRIEDDLVEARAASTQRTLAEPHPPI